MITARLYLGYKDTSQPNPFINSYELPKWAKKAWGEEEEERKTITTLFLRPWQGMKVGSREVWLWNVSLYTWTQNTYTEGDAAPVVRWGRIWSPTPAHEPQRFSWWVPPCQQWTPGPWPSPCFSLSCLALNETIRSQVTECLWALKFYDSTQVWWSTEWYLGQDVHCLGERGEPWPVPLSP